MELRYIVFDLEATCWRGRPPNGYNEIIEIGAIKVDAYGDPGEIFSRFVKPTVNPLLSPFCKQLTSITQEQVDSARPYPRVIQEFLDWSELLDDDVKMISWGENDKALFSSDCKLHKLDYDWTEKHVNLKQHYKELKRHTKHMGLKNALTHEGFEFDGDPHRGIDDALNLAKIFIKYIDEWNIQ
ncbi:MAG: exonuclease domain-containing protein [Saprospiraceae bacterium]|nr:exonuclease domain-containing protein [Saprospiraceae bacterium]